MEEEIDETANSLDEKDDEESEEQTEEERTSYPLPPSNESNSPTHTLFNVPSFLLKDECHDNCYDPIDSFEISLFMNLMLAILVAKMPIRIMLMEMNLLLFLMLNMKLLLLHSRMIVLLSF